MLCLSSEREKDALAQNQEEETVGCPVRHLTPFNLPVGEPVEVQLAIPRAR